MQAVVEGDEVVVDPNPQWVRDSLKRLTEAREGQRFFCLIRDTEDQFNVLCEPDGYVLEWYLGKEGGARAGFRHGEGSDHLPTRKKGFIASLFGPRDPIRGTRFSLDVVADIVDRYVRGADSFAELHWKRLYR